MSYIEYPTGVPSTRITRILGVGKIYSNITSNSPAYMYWQQIAKGAIHKQRQPIFPNLRPPSLPLLAKVTKQAYAINPLLGGTSSLCL